MYRTVDSARNVTDFREGSEEGIWESRELADQNDLFLFWDEATPTVTKWKAIRGGAVPTQI